MDEARKRTKAREEEARKKLSTCEMRKLDLVTSAADLRWLHDEEDSRVIVRQGSTSVRHPRASSTRFSPPIHLRKSTSLFSSTRLHAERCAVSRDLSPTSAYSAASEDRRERVRGREGKGNDDAPVHNAASPSLRPSFARATRKEVGEN
jgi:hypothetical protein